MKNLKNTLATLALVFAMMSIVSCEKGGGSIDPVKPGQEAPLEKSTISSKWAVSGSSGYSSFEFNESGNYIVTRSTAGRILGTQSVLFGEYEIINDSTILLADLGTLTIKSLKGESIIFSLSLLSDPGNEIEITASKEDEIAASSNTELLCRSWKMVSVDGQSVVGTEEELTVLFSEAGTYFVEFANPVDGDEGGLSNWQWKDASENTFCYSWEGTPTCMGDNEVEVVELSSTRLQLMESYDGMSTVYELVPAEGSSAGRIKAATNQNTIKIKPGFLSK